MTTTPSSSQNVRKNLYNLEINIYSDLLTAVHKEEEAKQIKTKAQHIMAMREERER